MSPYPDTPPESSPLSLGESLRVDPPHSEKGGDRPGASLVDRCISERGASRNPVSQVEIYLRGVRIKREYVGEAPPRGKRSEISSFTPGSKRRLKWAAANASPRLISTFGMTYHVQNPGGRECKRHLHAFLSAIRREYPGTGYLWILEFQKRKVAHFHVWLTAAHDTPGLHRDLAQAWHRIAEPESEYHLWWHNRPENFIPWEMKSGGYLCKYLDKVHQKIIPQGFTGIGRFWGASRGLVPPPVIIDTEDIPEPVIFVRTICKHHEAALRKMDGRRKFHHQARRSPCSYRLPNAADVAWGLIGRTPPPP